MYGVVITAGANLYNEDQNYADAYVKFRETLIVRPGDTLSLLYAGNAAQQAELYDEAIESYEELIETGHATVDIYNAVIYIQRNIKKDVNASIAAIDKAMEKFPENENYPQQKITLLITENMSDEAEKELQEEIEKHPDQELLRYWLGYLYDELDRDDEALEAYKKAVEIKPDYYEALFNIGAIYYNRGVIHNKSLGDLNPYDRDYRVKEDELVGKRNVEFNQALPYFEKAMEVKPDEVSLLETLAGIYLMMEMDDKAKVLEDKITKISGE